MTTNSDFLSKYDEYEVSGDVYFVTLNGKSNFVDKNGNELYDEWLDDVYNAYDSQYKYYIVECSLGCNYADLNGKLLSDVWFDEAYSFFEGFARVKLNGKWNFIDENGKYISDVWYACVQNFQSGFASIQEDDGFFGGRWNYIDYEGKILSEQWFESAWPFDFDGYGSVGIGLQRYRINNKGEVEFTIWRKLNPGNIKEYINV